MYVYLSVYDYRMIVPDLLDEDEKFAVGFFHPHTGAFITESTHQHRYAAADQCSYLNGGSRPKPGGNPGT